MCNQPAGVCGCWILALCVTQHHRCCLTGTSCPTSTCTQCSGKQLSSGNLGESREDVAEKSAPKLEAPKLEARRSEPLATDVSATAHWKSILSRAKPGDGAAKGGVAAPMVVSPVAQPGLTPTPTPTPTPAPPTEAGGDGRIARRYESQGVRYSLYEDGSIDAETETGVFRFGSLTELRAFLDQRKG